MDLFLIIKCKTLSMIFKSALSTLLFVILPILNFAQDLDYSLKVNIEIDIDQTEENHYKFDYSDKTSVTKLSEKSSKIKTFFIDESFFNKTDNISVKSKSGNFGKRDIPFVIPDTDDIFIAGGKVFYFGVPTSVKKDESFTYEYSQEFTDIAYLPFISLENDVEYESVTVTINHPDDVKPEFSVYGTFKDYPFEVSHPDDDETVLQIKNIKSSDELNYFPFNKYSLCLFIDLQKNGVSINKASPSEFVNWYSNLTSLQPELEEKDKNILSEDIKNCKTPIEKLKTIYDYVRLNFRYIADEQGHNSIVPRKPSIVLSRGYGDCKERASLVSAIAHEHGIDVKMALVTGPSALKSNLIYVNKFNHVICAYTLGEETIFFDPTAKHCEFGNLPESDIGKDALILDSLNPRLVTIKAPIQKPSFEIIISTSLDSLKKGKAIITLHNDYFSSAKYAIDELSGTKLENFMSGIVLSNLFKISLDYFTKVNETENSLIFSADADLSEFVISSATKKYIPKIPFLFLDRDLLDRAKDSLGLYLKSRTTIDLKIILESELCLVENDSLYLSDTNHFSEFSASASMSEGNNMEFSYSLKTAEKELNNKQKIEFIEFYQSYLINKPNMFILKAK